MPFEDFLGRFAVSPACKLRFWTTVAAAALLLPATASAQGSPNGGQAQVNSFTTSLQASPAVSSSAGYFRVVWESWGEGDGSDANIRSQSFPYAGQILPGGFLVNSFHTAGKQRSPAIAADSQGLFVIVWESYGQDGSGYGVRARLFDATGTPPAADFAVNTFTVGSQSAAAATYDGQGNFIVVWQSPQDGSGTSIHGRRFDGSGNPLSAEFQVNNYTSGDQSRPKVAADAAGNFVVVWQSDGPLAPDTSLGSIQARLFDFNGNPYLGPEFVVNTFTTGTQYAPAVVADDGGRYLVVWQSAGSGGSDNSGSSIQGQHLDFTGQLGEEFQLNGYATGNQVEPAVTFGADGFVVTWGSESGSGTDPDYSIQVRQLGALQLSEFQVNAYTTGLQRQSTVAVDARGDFLVVWSSYGSTGTDTSLSSIQARRFDALFRDNFETGNSSRWSGAVP